MRASSFLFMAVLTGCAAETAAPSLAPRAAEAIDPRVPVPEPAIGTQPSAELVERLQALVAQAVASDDNFRALADGAERLASAAGAPPSESWIVAQQALSAAVAARGPVTRALSEIDSVGASRIQAMGGIGPADLKAINAASAEVGAIDSRQAARLDSIQARLAR
jgi:hypothetical protein